MTTKKYSYYDWLNGKVVLIFSRRQYNNKEISEPILVSWDNFNEKEKATLWWAEEMTKNTAKSNIAVWKEMKRLFSDAEIVEISLNISMFAMINRLNDSFHTELESEEYNLRQHGAIGVTTNALDAYACRMCAASPNSK